MGGSGEKLFERCWDDVERALRFVQFRRRMASADFQEFRSFVMLKLVENDYARLRKHHGQGSIGAYLSVVVHRLYLDYQIGRWGKWHPSAEARRRGPTAVELERLVYRDGYEIREAVEYLATRDGSANLREELVGLAYTLPVRHRPRIVADEQLIGAGGHPPADPVERGERDALARKLQAELSEAMASLDDDDRLVLKLRYRDHRTVPQIAKALGLDTKPLYSRIRRVLGRVRKRLERAGLGGEHDAAYLVSASACEIDLDGLFSGTAA